MLLLCSCSCCCSCCLCLPYGGIRYELEFKFISFQVRVCLDTRSARLQDEEWEGRENFREEDRKSACESERAEGRLNLN